MKIVVDYDSCESNGRCMRAAPKVFKVDEDGNLEILDDSPPEGMRAEVERAVRLCPKQAIKLEE